MLNLVDIHSLLKTFSPKIFANLGTNFTLNNFQNATLSSQENIGFLPKNNFLLATNDIVNIPSFNDLKNANVSISDPSNSDYDVVNINLQETQELITEFNANLENIETLHIDLQGNILTVITLAEGSPISFDDHFEILNNKIKNLQTIELSGDATGEIDIYSFNYEQEDGTKLYYQLPASLSKIDASGVTNAIVVLDAFDTNVKVLIGGAMGDYLGASKNGILTGNGGADQFDVGGIRLDVSSEKNNFVTITDLTPNDAIIFNLKDDAFVNVDRATNLTPEIPNIDTISEAELINVIQQKADTKTANGLYYVNTQTDTYIVANGNLGDISDDTVVKCLGIHNLEEAKFEDGMLIHHLG